MRASLGPLCVCVAMIANRSGCNPVFFCKRVANSDLKWPGIRQLSKVISRAASRCGLLIAPGIAPQSNRLMWRHVDCRDSNLIERSFVDIIATTDVDEQEDGKGR